MNKPMIRIHNIETNEVIDREMTDAEFQIWKEDLKQQEQEKIKLEAKLVQKQALLDRLGITADEAKLLLG